MSSLKKDTLLYSIANWGQRFLGFLIAPVTLAFFSKADFGYISLVNTSVSMACIVAMLAVADQGLPRFFVDAKNEEEKQSYSQTALGITLAGNLLVCVAGILFLPFARHFISGQDPVFTVFLILFGCLAQSYAYFGNSLLRWTFQSGTFMGLNLVRAALVVAVCATGILKFGWGPKQTLSASFIIVFLCAVAANLRVLKYMSLKNFDSRRAKTLLLFSAPLLGINLCAFFSTSLDRFFISAMLGLDKLGSFSAAYTVSNFFSILTSGFFMAMGPYYLETYKNKAAPQQYAKLFGKTTVVSLLCITVLGLWGDVLVGLIKKDGSYAGIGVYIPWILAAKALYAQGAYFAPGPYIKKQTKYNLAAFVVASGANALLNWMLIPRFGILGAGLGTAIANLAAAIMLQIISHRLYPVPNRWKTAFMLILATSSVVCAVELHSPTLFEKALATVLILAACACVLPDEIKSAAKSLMKIKTGNNRGNNEKA